MKPRQPSTTQASAVVEGKVPSPSDSVRQMWQRGAREGLRHSSGGGFFIGERKPCRFKRSSARNVRQTYPLDARYVCEQCFGPLEVAYDHSGLDPADDQAADPGRPAVDLALRGLPAVRVAASAGSPGRADPAPAGTAAGRAARPRRGLGQERHRQPHAFVQGPRGGRGPGKGPGAGLRGGGLRLHGQPGRTRWRPMPPRRGSSPTCSSRRTSRSRRSSPRGLRHAPGGRARHLRRRQPALHRALRRARLGVRERERAAVLRRGVEDARVRDRRAARVRAARPRGGAGGLGLALHEDRPRVRGVARGGAGRGRAPRVQRRPGRGLLARGHGLRGRARTSAGRSSRARSPSRWPSATPPTVPTRSIWRAARAARSSRSPTRRSGRASGCWPRPPGSSPRPRAA